MPLYEYQCDACGHRFEQIQKFSDPPVEVCPNCGERQVKKLLSTPAIQFKGSGWYITDYARKGADGKEGADAKQTPESKPSKESSESQGAKETPKAAASDNKTGSSSSPAPASTPSKAD